MIDLTDQGESFADVLVFKRAMKKTDTRICRHRRIYVDGLRRAVWCRDCEVDIDPIDAIVKYADQHDNILRRAKAERDEGWVAIEEVVAAGGRVTISPKGAQASASINGRKVTRKGSRGSLAEAVVAAALALLSDFRWGGVS